jgi:hypothetical protein
METLLVWSAVGLGRRKNKANVEREMSEPKAVINNAGPAIMGGDTADGL